MIGVLLVAPTLAMRAGLRALLSAAEGVEVIQEAPDLSELVEIPVQADVLLVTSDATIEADLWRLASLSQGRLAVLLMGDERAQAEPLSRYPFRAWGVLTLDATPEELAAAVHALDQGLLVGTPSLIRPMLSQRLVLDSGDGVRLDEPLTERESEVLQLLARGLANKQIALSLGISEHTVKFHVSSIYSKLGVSNRTEAVRVGVQQGFVVL